MAGLVPAIPVIGHYAILTVIAGKKPGDDAMSFAPVTNACGLPHLPRERGRWGARPPAIRAGAGF
jgi:hypothetical protein